jgi:uncharacterized protein YndB with AHSA1/START domain
MILNQSLDMISSSGQGPLPDYNFDGIVYCKVLEVVPFKKLSYSWKSGPGNGGITIDSLVVWTLDPKEGGTQLLLEHSGFKKLEDLNLIRFDGCRLAEEHTQNC